MDTSDAELTKLVNRSGFVFQMAIEHTIESKIGSKFVFVASSEHPWIDQQTAEQAFIDLVVEFGILRLVIECKRVKGGKWLFLVPKGSPAEELRSQLVWAGLARDGKAAIGVDSGLLLSPPCRRSSICIIRAEGEDERTLLERYSSKLLRSIEVLANEEVDLPAIRDVEGLIYIPVIVTTASLKVAEVDASTVSLADGTVPKLSFDEVPFIKFHKSLVTDLSPLRSVKSLRDASRDKERTVVVVNAENLLDFLRKIDVRAKCGEFPWHVLTSRSKG